MCSNTILSSFYEAKQKLRDLGLGYETIHTCKYDCVLYWKEFADLQHCPTCGEARYKNVLVGLASETNFFMSLLIPIPRSPSRKIDVYLQSLIEEFKELRNFGGGVQRGIRYPSYAWVIDRRLRYEVEYPSWDLDAIFGPRVT
ncbi:hypothetical protein E6C27_scaffold21G00470 [Cucumis melo var. makuwa]|uniref:Transposase n=1 Tax=Cucumis melo var. makuwa TaxID=1194695 RepID=A0A5A7VK08_CUCMM|nr:hypothetical protein E6C27_scaffold21G00470 [Cucumis melo var. makuwa]